MNDSKLDKLKRYISLTYPKGSWFEKAELNMLDINAYAETQGWQEVFYLIDVLVKEGFLTSDYRFGKNLYEINSSETAEKNHKNDSKLNKFKNYILQKYPRGSIFTEEELNLVDINNFVGTSSYKEIKELLEDMLREGFLNKFYREGKDYLEVNSSKTTEKENKNGKQMTDISRSQKSGSNEIVAHDFEKKKQQLRKFAKNFPKTSNLPIVRGGNHLFGISVKATGDDLNKLSERIGDSLIKQNKNIVDIRKEFISIYDTFEALDKDYIQRILVNLKATEEANRKAVQGLEQNNKLFNSQKTIIEVLKKHKDELDNLKHLKEIDELYNAYTNFELYQEKNIEELRTSQEKVDKKLVELQKSHKEFYDEQSEKVSSLQTKQERTSTELLESQGKFDSFSEIQANNINEIKAIQKKSDENLNALQKIHKDFEAKQSEEMEEIRANQLETRQELSSSHEIYNSFVETQDNSIKEILSNQEQMNQKLKYFKIAFIISLIIILGLIALIISGVL